MGSWLEGDGVADDEDAEEGCFAAVEGWFPMVNIYLLYESGSRQCWAPEHSASSNLFLCASLCEIRRVDYRDGG